MPTQPKIEIINCFISIPLSIFAAGADYESFSQSFLFRPLATINEQKVCHNLTLFDDSLLENQESLTITMEVSHPGVSIHINRATVIIMDDDEVTLSLRSSASVVSEDVGQVRVCVDLEGSTEKTIEYSIVTQPGTAQGRASTDKLAATYLYS